MAREASLPTEWQCLADRVRFVQFESVNTVVCSCPVCGGEVHDDGSWPDRCVLWHGPGRIAFLYCRKCGAKGFPDQFGGPNSPAYSPEEAEKYRQEQIQREEARKRSAEKSLALLRDHRAWERYYDQLAGKGRELWQGRGVPDCYQDAWMLGYDPAHHFGPHVSPTLTIPIFNQSWQALNIKHRLLNPNGSGKYLYEQAGLGQPPFLAYPEASYTEKVYLVEGEIKAMVVASRIDDPRLAIVGMPGCTCGDAALDIAKDASDIILIVDPDARMAAWKLTKKLGRERCRVYRDMKWKIDDAILAAGLDGGSVRRLLDNAVPAV